MKILWISHLVPYPPKGGVLQRCYNLIREVAKHHEVILLGFVQTDILKAMFPSVEKGLKEAIEHLGRFCSHVDFVNIPCEKSSNGKQILALKSMLTSDPYTINWLKSKEMLLVIANIKKDYEFDLVHFDTISLAYYLPWFAGIPKVLDHHNIESHMMLRRAEQESNLLKRIYFNFEGNKLRKYEARVCCEFDLHITCSSLDSSRLADIDSSLTIREVPNGVDIDYFYPQSGNEIDRNLVFAGGLGWYPNADAMRYFAAEIWPILKKRVPDIVMNVVGKNPPEMLSKLSEEDSNFRVHGFVDDVREYISRASVYVCPIRDGGGTKLKLLDAFAMGMATVAHPAACEGLDVTEGKNILLASSTEEFYAAIEKLIRDKELRKTIGLNARKLVVEKYSFKTIGKHLSDMYSHMGTSKNLSQM